VGIYLWYICTFVLVVFFSFEEKVSMSKVIFRVQSKDSLGPHQGKMVNHISRCIPNLYEKHNDGSYPGIWRDFEKQNIHGMYEHKVGCPSACMFFLWFGEYIQDVINHYEIYAIRIKEYKLSDSKIQCLYMPRCVIKKQRLFIK
jgi:hypothetical protein